MLLHPMKEIFLKPARYIFTLNKHVHILSSKYFLPVRKVSGTIRIPVKARISKNADFLHKQAFSSWKVGITRSSYQYQSACRTNLSFGRENITHVSSTFLKQFGSVSCIRHLCTINNKTTCRLGFTKYDFLSPRFLPQARIWKRGSTIKRRGEKDGVENWIMLMVYGSCAVGAILISSIAFSHLQKLYKRFVHGIHIFYDPPFGRRQKLLKYKDVIIPAMLEKKLDEIRKFTVRADDVWVVSWPRSGKTKFFVFV